MRKIKFTEAQRKAISIYLAYTYIYKKCNNCSHYNSCQGEYWDWSDICKECHLNNNWSPNAETKRKTDKEVDDIINFKKSDYKKERTLK